MNDTVQAALELEYLTLTRAVEPSTEPLGYGTDLRCTFDLDPLLAEVDPETTDAIAESVIRRYITPRGGLIDDPDYGLDLRSHCNRGITRADLRALSGALQGEAQKDDRVAEAAVALTADLRGRDLKVQATIEPADPDAAEFAFTFVVTDGSVLAVTIQ